MDDQDAQRRLDQLRHWRHPKPRDLSLQFVADLYRRDIVRPHMQLGPMVKVWQQSLPAPLLASTALEGFVRGVLTVLTPDSSVLYQLDRLLRSGLEKQLQQATRGALKKVRLKVDISPFSQPDPQ